MSGKGETGAREIARGLLWYSLHKEMKANCGHKCEPQCQSFGVSTYEGKGQTTTSQPRKGKHDKHYAKRGKYSTPMKTVSRHRTRE